MPTFQELNEHHRARPPLSERLSLGEAVLLADATRCPINLLRLSSREVVTAAVAANRDYLHLDIRLETTVHNLALTYDCAGGIREKVNPPIRTEDDRKALWEAVVRGEVDTVVSDHACCFEEEKGRGSLAGHAKLRWDGAALPLPDLGGAPPARDARCEDRRAGQRQLRPRLRPLPPEGHHRPRGADADLTIVDPDWEHEVHPEFLLSAQDFTPFAGAAAGWPTRTVRGARWFARMARSWKGPWDGAPTARCGWTHRGGDRGRGGHTQESGRATR